jgi:DNA-binding CsgD family transcriptional regulator
MDGTKAMEVVLSPAEARVLKLLSRAKTNKEIAMDLGLSPATVKRHMEKILTKLGLRNRVEAAIYGLMLNGCPQVLSEECVFRKLRAGVAHRASLNNRTIDA